MDCLCMYNCETPKVATAFRPLVGKVRSTKYTPCLSDSCASWVVISLLSKYYSIGVVVVDDPPVVSAVVAVLALRAPPVPLQRRWSSMRPYVPSRSWSSW